MQIKIRSFWTKLCGSLAVLLIFMVPAARNVVGKIVNITGNATNNQATGNNNNNSNNGSNSVPSVSQPSSGPAISPINGSSSNGGGSGHRKPPRR